MGPIGTPKSSKLQFVSATWVHYKEVGRLWVQSLAGGVVIAAVVSSFRLSEVVLSIPAKPDSILECFEIWQAICLET